MGVTTDAPRLPIMLRPEAGENACGFLRRLAAANGHRGVWVFSRALGLGADFGPLSAGRIWKRLADAAGLTDADVAGLRWSLADRARPGPETTVIVAGTRTRRDFIHPTVARLCPLCLRETGVWRAFWSFSCIVACPRHGTLLVTACSCGRPLLPRDHGRIWACACGVAAGDLGAGAAPASATEVARNLAARVGTASGYTCENNLAAPFDGLDAHDYMALVHTLGIAATTPACEDAPMLPEQRLYRKDAYGAMLALDLALARLQGATDIIHGWPDAYMSLLGDVEGRNTSTNASKISGAFATVVGRLLARPVRGADGLPLRILNQAFERYWIEHHDGRFRRRPRLLSNDATAKRLQRHVNAAILARAVGVPRDTMLLRRVVRRVFERLDDEDRSRADKDLARLVYDRAIALFRAVMASMPACAVRQAVEGTPGGRALSGWEHPRLIPADPALHGLWLSGKPAYAPEAARAALVRLRTVACRVERSDGLVPLMTAGLRGSMRPWYSKTDVLLDVMDGKLVVYTAVDAPKLGDLFVNIEDLRQARFAHDPINGLAADGGFAPYKQVNILLLGQFGPTGQLTIQEFRRLTRAGLVRWRSEHRGHGDRGNLHRTRLYNMADTLGFVRRRLSPAGLSVAEAASFGRIHDVGPLLSTMRGSGMGACRIEAELLRRGVRTENGAAWPCEFIAKAITQVEQGKQVPGLLTGPAFCFGAATPEPLGPVVPG